MATLKITTTSFAKSAANHRSCLAAITFTHRLVAINKERLFYPFMTAA